VAEKLSNGLVLLILAPSLTLAHAQSEGPPQESTSMSKMNALSVARPVTILIAVILLPISLTSCGRSGSDGEKKTTQKSDDDFLDKDAKPDERKYLLAAKPFFVAVANRKMPTLTRYSPATPRHVCPSTSLHPLRNKPLSSNTNRVRI
jgi:hypothetical protein